MLTKTNILTVSGAIGRAIVQSSVTYTHDDNIDPDNSDSDDE